MFCPQCGAQAEQQVKFCRSCGLKLSDHAQLLPRARELDAKQMSPDEAEREVRLLNSTKALVVNVALLPVSLALVSLAFLMLRLVDTAARSKGEMIPLIILSAIFLTSHLYFSFRSIFNLFRSGFFDMFKKRLIRAEAILLDRPISYSADNPDLPPETNRISHHITEHTTHQLQQPGINSESHKGI